MSELNRNPERPDGDPKDSYLPPRNGPAKDNGQTQDEQGTREPESVQQPSDDTLHAQPQSSGSEIIWQDATEALAASEADDVESLVRDQNYSAVNLDLDQINAYDPERNLSVAEASRRYGSRSRRKTDRFGEVTESPITSARGSGGRDEVALNPQSVSASDLWRSLLWLVTLVLMFLSVITVGPYLVERYQYAAAKGRMKAQYEAATDMLSQVSFKDSTLASELVVHKIRPSVVSVRAISNASISRFVVQGTGQGSGVVLSQDGYIVTNNHVVENADRIEVTLSDRREFVARVIGQDRETDLAVLKIDGSDLIAAEWGNSNELELGSAVWAMGSPFGLDQTVTRGIISGKHRRTADTMGVPNPHQDLLQTDAAINPGNSGGPLGEFTRRSHWNQYIDLR